MRGAGGGSEGAAASEGTVNPTGDDVGRAACDMAAASTSCSMAVVSSSSSPSLPTGSDSGFTRWEVGLGGGEGGMGGRAGRWCAGVWGVMCVKEWPVLPEVHCAAAGAGLAVEGAAARVGFVGVAPAGAVVVAVPRVWCAVWPEVAEGTRQEEDCRGVVAVHGCPEPDIVGGVEEGAGWVTVVVVVMVRRGKPPAACWERACGKGVKAVVGLADTGWLPVN